MTITVLALLTVNEDAPQALAQYLEATAPLIETAGAKIIRRYRVQEAVAGSCAAQTAVVVEYPDRAAVDLVFESPAYKAIIPVRDKAFLTYNINVMEAAPH